MGWRHTGIRGVANRAWLMSPQLADPTPPVEPPVMAWRHDKRAYAQSLHYAIKD